MSVPAEEPTISIPPRSMPLATAPYRWEFKDGMISRENVWLDGGAVVQQLTAPVPEAAGVDGEPGRSCSGCGRGIPSCGNRVPA